MEVLLDCIPCMLRQTLAASRMATSDARLQERIVREVLKTIAETPYGQTPPHVGREIHRVIRELSGDGDPYREEKRRFNDAALALYPWMKEKVRAARDPFEAAARLAIAGNIMDSAVLASDDVVDWRAAVEKALAEPLATNDLGRLRSAADGAESILYLADNAGEIVFDRLLLEELPAERVTLAVRGAPVLNDATLEDAARAGLTGAVAVISNGSDAPGTILETCSAEFRAHFERAEVVVSKGQGNFETLSDSGKEGLFFLLKAKCPAVARELDCREGALIAKGGVTWKERT